MSRRPSHASVTGLRRGSQVDASKTKRVSLKDGTLGNISSRLGSLSDIKEGDTFYRIERIYPSIPDHPEEVVITVATRFAREARNGSIAGINRDEAGTPSEGPTTDRER